MPEETVFDVLKNDVIYTGREFESYSWEMVVDKFLLQYAARTLDVFRIILDQL